MKKRHIRIPKRETAICLQYGGMAIFIGSMLLSLFFCFDRETLLFYSGTSLLMLGSGVLIRRYYDHD